MARTKAAGPTRAGEQWKNRIESNGLVDPEQLLANPNNYRIHPGKQQKAMLDLLREVGVVQDVIVNQRTGFVVDGHLRVQLAISEGQKRIPVKYVDLTDGEEALVLATFDPIASLAAYDREIVAERGPGTAKGVHGEDLKAFLEDFFSRVAGQAPDSDAGNITELPPGEEPDGSGGSGSGGEEDEDEEIDEGQKVRAVNIWFDQENLDKFHAQVSALMVHYGVDNVTDVVAKAVFAEFERIPAQEVGSNGHIVQQDLPEIVREREPEGELVGAE